MSTLPEGTVIRDGACEYRLLKPIGNWGPNVNLPVYEAVILPETANVPHVAMKIISKIEIDDMIVAIDDVHKITDYFEFLPHTILPIKKQFRTALNGDQYLCIVLLFDPSVVSIRSLISSRPSLAQGIPPPCIAAVLQRVIHAVNELHNIKAIHDQITAGTVLYHHNDAMLKLAYAASVYEPLSLVLDQEASTSTSTSSNPNANLNEEAPVVRMSIWARAPEVVEGRRNGGIASYINNSKESDIWLIGILALEMAYGRIRVKDRKEMLAIADFVGKNRVMPDTWEQLRASVASGEMPQNSAGRFSEDFGNFVGRCLLKESWKRPSLNWLWNHDFLKTGAEMGYFVSVVVKGLPLEVAKAATPRNRPQRPLIQGRRSNLGRRR